MRYFLEMDVLVSAYLTSPLFPLKNAVNLRLPSRRFGDASDSDPMRRIPARPKQPLQTFSPNVFTR